MTPAAIELALEIRREIELRYQEADQLRCRAMGRAQTEADLAQRRFMLVDPSNRLVADMLHLRPHVRESEARTPRRDSSSAHVRAALQRWRRCCLTWNPENLRVLSAH